MKKHVLFLLCSATIWQTNYSSQASSSSLEDLKKRETALTQAITKIDQTFSDQAKLIVINKSLKIEQSLVQAYINEITNPQDPDAVKELQSLQTKRIELWANGPLNLPMNRNPTRFYRDQQLLKSSLFEVQAQIYRLQYNALLQASQPGQKQ